MTGRERVAKQAGVDFRVATLADVPELLALVTSAYRGEASRAGWTTEADLLDGPRTDLEGIAAMVTGAGGLVLVATQTAADGPRTAAPGSDDRVRPALDAGAGGADGADGARTATGPNGAAPAGRILACCQLERRGAAGYFGMFAVVPTLQAAGLGSAVLAEAERYARAVWGADRLEMQVIAQRADLIAWYTRRGYRPTGDTRPFPYGDERFGLPRRPDLAFSVLSKRF